MDPNEFNRNLSAHTPDELAPCYGQRVAWSLDGKESLAHAPTEDELYAEIGRRGLKQYVLGFVPDPDVSYF